MDTKILDEKLERFFNNEGFDVRKTLPMSMPLQRSIIHS